MLAMVATWRPQTYGEAAPVITSCSPGFQAVIRRYQPI
jgi:hypothetical protein